MSFSVTREIGIDAGHRVMTHGSKCRNIHGHRYTVQVTCTAEDLHEKGEQTDMVLDFGFLKDLMMEYIDKPCDHGFIASVQDDFVLGLFNPYGPPTFPTDPAQVAWLENVRARVKADGYFQPFDVVSKLYVVPFIPTAEQLAKHWFERLSAPVQDRSKGLATVTSVTVWETPNCAAQYP